MKAPHFRFRNALIAAVLAFAPLAASAVTLLPPCTKNGDCGITDILAVFLNIGEYLLGISGAVALAYFIWGGFQMVLSAGSAEKVKSGKDTIVRATIGIAIIFLSGILVRFTQQALIGRANNVCVPGDATSGKCTPAVGDTCNQGGATSALWISIPAGFTDPSNPAGTFVKESLECVQMSADCGPLNSILTNRNRKEGQVGYTCVDVSRPDVLSCVRGLCTAASGFACCLCNDGHGGITRCSGAAPRS